MKGGDDINKLKEERQKAGLTREELSKQSGVSIRTLEGIEQGRRSFGGVAVETALKIADALEIDVRKLI